MTGDRPDRRRPSVSARLAGCIVAVGALIVGCGTSTGSPSPAGSPVTTSKASDASSSARIDRPPELLVQSPDGSAFAIVDPAKPTVRRPLALPAGQWAITTGPASVAAYTTDTSAPTQIRIGTIINDLIQVTDTLTLPLGERWAGGYPACLSASGLLLVADSGLSFSLIAPGAEATVLPKQRDNRGACVWLDDGHAVWDEENEGLALFDLETASTVQVASPPIVRDPSGGEGWIAGGTGALGLVVSPYQLDGTTLKIGKSLAVPEGAYGSLASDGRWLVARIGDADVATVFAVSKTGLTKRVEVPLNPDEDFSWLPVPGA